MNVPGHLDAAQFKAAMACFASGVTVVTARAPDGTDHGMTVSSFCSLSLQPPLVLTCIDASATLLPHLLAAETFGISMLSASQGALSTRFADQTIDRFDDVAFSRGATGPALLDGAVAHLECRRVAVHPGGDHHIIVGEVLSARVLTGSPLVYAQRAYGRVAPLPVEPRAPSDGS